MKTFNVGIVTLNRYDLLVRCLDSVFNTPARPMHVSVIDNGRSRFEHVGVNVYKPERQLSLGAAWNILIEASMPQPIIILNDDIEILPGGFQTLLKSDGDFVTTKNGFQAFLIRQGAWDAVGPFEEMYYPAYLEDNDYWWRLKNSDVRNIVLDIDIVKQNGPSATLAAMSTKEQAIFYAQRAEALRHYQRKWGGSPGEERFKEPFDGR